MLYGLVKMEMFRYLKPFAPEYFNRILGLLFILLIVKASEESHQSISHNNSETADPHMYTIQQSSKKQRITKINKNTIIEALQEGIIFTDINKILLPNMPSKHTPTFARYATYAYYATHANFSDSADKAIHACNANLSLDAIDNEYISEILEKKIKNNILALNRPYYADYATHAIYSHNSYNAFCSNNAVYRSLILDSEGGDKYIDILNTHNNTWRNNILHLYTTIKIDTSTISYYPFNKPNLMRFLHAKYLKKLLHTLMEVQNEKPPHLQDHVYAASYQDKVVEKFTSIVTLSIYKRYIVIVP